MRIVYARSRVRSVMHKYYALLFIGFSGDFSHSFCSNCFHWDSRSVGFSALIRGKLAASNALNAAFIRFSGCLSPSSSFTLKSQKLLTKF